MLAVAGPKLEMSWKNPGYSGGKFKKILVLALNGKAANRMEFEDQLVAAISRPAGKVYPSYEFILRPGSGLRSSSLLWNFLRLLQHPIPRGLYPGLHANRESRPGRSQPVLHR